MGSVKAHITSFVVLQVWSTFTADEAKLSPFLPDIAVQIPGVLEAKTMMQRAVVHARTYKLDCVWTKVMVKHSRANLVCCLVDKRD